MRDLVQKLPSSNQTDHGTSDDTIAAVLATLNEVIKKHAEFSRQMTFKYFLFASFVMEASNGQMEQKSLTNFGA